MKTKYSEFINERTADLTKIVDAVSRKLFGLVKSVITGTRTEEPEGNGYILKFESFSLRIYSESHYDRLAQEDDEYLKIFFRMDDENSTVLELANYIESLGYQRGNYQDIDGIEFVIFIKKKNKDLYGLDGWYFAEDNPSIKDLMRVNKEDFEEFKNSSKFGI